MLRAFDQHHVNCLMNFRSNESLRLVHHIILDVEDFSFYDGVDGPINLFFDHLFKLGGKYILDFGLDQVVDFADNLQIDFFEHLLSCHGYYLRIDLIRDHLVSLFLHISGDLRQHFFFQLVEDLRINHRGDHHVNFWSHLMFDLLLNQNLEFCQDFGFDFHGDLVFYLSMDLQFIVDLHF